MLTAELSNEEETDRHSPGAPGHPKHHFDYFQLGTLLPSNLILLQTQKSTFACEAFWDSKVQSLLLL